MSHGSNLSSGLESLTLEMPPELTGELGTIPKVASLGGKKRRNRRQKNRDDRDGTQAEVAHLETVILASRVPEVQLCENEEAHDEEEEDNVTLDKETFRPQQGSKKSCSAARRKRGGKRKKQVSPDPKSDDKENREKAAAAAAIAGLKTDEEDDEDEGGRKFLWRNVTKNGWIKKCVLVDGLVEGGRPQAGDTVLVKSQGKLKDGKIIDDFPTLVFNVGQHEVIEGLDVAVQSMHKNELSILSVKPEMAYGQLGRKGDIPAGSRITYLFGLLHFERQKEISQLTWAQRRKSGQSRLRLANWWYQRKEYPVAVKVYKKALEFYNNIPTNQECSSPEEYKELLQLMEERLRVMRQVANIFKRIANLIQSGQISS